MLEKYGRALKHGRPEHQKYDSFSIRHPAMPLLRRAKIFNPFDALKGFDEAVAAKDIQYEKKRELSEEDARRLDLILNALKALTINSKIARENQVRATITYYVPCNDADNEAYKVMGTYEEITGIIYRVDTEVYRNIRLDDHLIPIADIIDIKSEQAEKTIISRS